MDKNELKNQIMRLIDHAPKIAPSIKHFEEDGHYGRVIDTDFDYNSYIVWEQESEILLRQLAKNNPDIYSSIFAEYKKNKQKAPENHSKAIFLHQVRQLLHGACLLLDSPITSLQSPLISCKNANHRIESNYAFIAMPMDPEDFSLTDVLDAVKEAAAKCGVRAERIDEPQSNERITDRIMESIQQAEYVIVDLSKAKPNVFFEAGYAHGLGRIPIYFAKHGTELEFDLRDYPVLFYRNLSELKQSIEKRIKGLRGRNKN